MPARWPPEPEPPRCSECGCFAYPGHAARCGVPKMIAAIGIEPTPREKRYIAWLAGSADFETIDVLVGYFTRARTEAACCGKSQQVPAREPAIIV